MIFSYQKCAFLRVVKQTALSRVDPAKLVTFPKLFYLQLQLGLFYFQTPYCAVLFFALKLAVKTDLLWFPNALLSSTDTFEQQGLAPGNGLLTGPSSFDGNNDKVCHT
jgi:hypothetical protein